MGEIDVRRAPPPPVVGIKAGAGLGKTGAALEQIAAIPGIEQMNIEIYVPDHRLAEELAERVAPWRRPAATHWHRSECYLRVLVIKGRGAGASPCKKAELAEELGKAGLDVMRSSAG